MAGNIQIKHGTKMRMAFDVPAGQEPQFSMISTFNKALDESAFLVSVPMVDGKALVADETKKILFRYGEGEEQAIVAGYVDDVVKEGIRRYWKVRRVTENRQFIQRRDVRMKIELPVTYMQDTWALNSEGEIDKEQGRLRIVYRTVGAGTKEFSGYQAGDPIVILGPLGNGFPQLPVEKAIPTFVFFNACTGFCNGQIF